MPTDGSDDVPRDDLTAYISAYLARTGQSVRELARRARDPISGISPSHGWLNDIVTGQMERAPDMRRLRALAAAINEPVETLARLAAAQWLGVRAIEVPIEDDAWLAIPVPRDLAPQERERRRRMVEDIFRHMNT